METTGLEGAVLSGLDAAPAGLAPPPDWIGLGLTLSIVGCFLLATAILTRSPRDLIEQRFGSSRPSLRSIREPIAGRVQLLLGFAFLMAGFGLHLYGRLALGLAGEAVVTGEAAAATGRVPAFYIGLIVVCAAGLSMVGWWWSNVLVRRHLRAYFREHPRDFETDMPLAREVGELFGVVPHAEDTVQTYVARLRRKADLPTRAAQVQQRPEPELEDTGDLAVGDFLHVIGPQRNRS